MSRNDTLPPRSPILLLPLVAMLLLSPAGTAQDKPSSISGGSGDALPPGAIARFGTPQGEHGKNVCFVAFANEGKEVLSSCGDGAIHVWDLKSGKLLRQVGEPIGIVGKAVLKEAILSDDGAASIRCWIVASNDGKRLVMLSDDDTV